MKLLNYLFIFTILLNVTLQASNSNKKIIYLNSDINVPFWKTMSNGIKDVVIDANYDFEVFDAQNSSKKELELTVKAIKEKVDGIIVSPTNSSACVTILKLAKSANIPIIISDVGADTKDYISYISSNNYKGAFEIGQVLSKQMKKRAWQDGKVGIIAIPQKRINGQKRTSGFMKALTDSGIKGAAIKQMITWTQEETYNYTKQMINEFPNLRAIWLQTSSTYKGALQAIKESNKEDEIILIAFDAEPEFLELIPKGKILASGMQQPYLMGQAAAVNMIKHLNNEKVKKDIQIPVLVVSTDNISNNLDMIKLNVLGIKQQ